MSAHKNYSGLCQPVQTHVDKNLIKSLPKYGLSRKEVIDQEAEKLDRRKVLIAGREHVNRRFHRHFGPSCAAGRRNYRAISRYEIEALRQLTEVRFQATVVMKNSAGTMANTFGIYYGCCEAPRLS